MELELIRGIWDYHRWGNRPLFVAAAHRHGALFYRQARSQPLPALPDLEAT